MANILSGDINPEVIDKGSSYNPVLMHLGESGALEMGRDEPDWPKTDLTSVHC